MNIQKLICDRTCYIVSSELKEEILSYLSNNKLVLDVHFFSVNQFIERCYFKYDIVAIYQVSKHFNVTYDNAKMLIENLYYLMYSNVVEDEKYIYLLTIKNYLDELKLLKYDPLFLEYLNRYRVITDLSPSNEFLSKINELLNNKIEFISLEEKDNATVFNFSNSDNEIEYLANEISSLIYNGIEPSKIHILNCNKDYYSYIDKIFTLYNIPYELNIKNRLLDYPYIKKIYNQYKLDEQIIFDEKHLDLTNKFKSLLEITNDKDFLLYLLKNTSSTNETYSNCIKFSDYQSIYLDDHYYYFIGLNNKVFPLYRKDEDYLSDELKKKLGYLTSYEINGLIKKYSINRLKSKSNLFISYRNSDYFNSYLKSDLINLISDKVINNETKNEYSMSYDILKLTRKLDNFYKYNDKSNELLELLSKLDTDKYKSFDHSYNQVDKDLYINNILKNKLSISYSSFEKFNECNYKYYLDSILKDNESKFTTYIGNLFHHILERIYEKDFDFKNQVDSFESDYILNDKETILLENLLNDFKEKISIILDQYNNSDYKKYSSEQRISIIKNDDLLININGIIDKIMMDNDGHAFVVDYKTGDTKSTLDYLNLGLKCQLPFYFYLLKHSKEYADIFLVGCYLQIIDLKIKSYNDTGRELLLEGYTYNDKKIIKGIDSNYESNSFIKGIKPNKNGLGTYAKLFTNDEFNHILDMMERNITSMINLIKDAKFEINPKLISQNETTCRYCKYNDICYHTFKDYIDVKEVLENE